MRNGRAPARTGILHATRFVRFGILTLTFTGLLAACSASAAGSNGVVTLASAAPGGSAAPSASPADPKTAMLDYAQCMRDHGIDMPDPVFVENGSSGGATGGTFRSEANGAGPAANPKSNPAFKDADAACRHFLANITKVGDGKTMTAEEQKAFLDFAACMRDHGIDMADPTFSGGGVSVQIGSDEETGPKIDPQSPAFQAAQDACQHFLTDAGLKGPGGIGGDSGPSTNVTGPDATTGTSTETAAP